MIAVVMRFSEMSPIDGYMAISLSATYHCTAAVPATVLTMTFGIRYGSERRIEHTRLVPFVPLMQDLDAPLNHNGGRFLARISVEGLPGCARQSGNLIACDVGSR